MEVPSDEDLLEGVKRAIKAGGGTSVIAARTGIPLGTLNKYTSGTSMPSLANAARIAAAAGLSLTQLAGASAPTTAAPADIASFSVALYVDIQAMVDRLHRDEGISASAAVVNDEARRHFGDLVGKLDNVGDLEEARALMPWLENRIRKELREAVAAPGTGKREAS